MNNLFDFNYVEQDLLNLDGTSSRFSTVYGQGGNLIHCKKDSYHIIKTSDISNIGNAFIDSGKDVTPFVHRNGEVIGLNINFGQRLTKVGDKTYNALITVPNNGGGKGFLSIKENRLICTNGLVRSDKVGSFNSIKIPHTIDYETSIELMHQSLTKFDHIIKFTEEHDNVLNKEKLENTEIMFHLNKWFFEKEMPESHKVGNMTLNDFRRLLVEDPNSIKSIDRYNQLMLAYQNELSYLDDLKAERTKYTVIATISNYISRRIEMSNSTASDEVQFARQSKKLENIFA